MKGIVPTTWMSLQVDSFQSFQLRALDSAFETEIREPSEANPDFWPTELWNDKIVLF